ncbi:MAG: hypothetical protein GY718_09945 [Lentisphaerae bacterium]|nr:hypothetical protein [Lentisphaerota bacterium]
MLPYLDNQCKKALACVLTHGEFFSKIPLDLMRQLEGDPKQNLNLAWQKIMYAMEKFGFDASIQFDDLALHGAVQTLGGWAYLNRLTFDELKWAKKQFDDLYPALVGNADLPDYIQGHDEKNGYSTGYKFARIGDVDGSIQTFKAGQLKLGEPAPIQEQVQLEVVR